MDPHPPSPDETSPHSAGSPQYPFLSRTDCTGELGWLGPYRVISLLGSGGMGFVFRAEDDNLRRPVALKVMRLVVAAEPTAWDMRLEVAAELTARERFLREGRAAAAIKSDHVTTIYQVGEANGVPFLAMEFLEGQTLEDWLKARSEPVTVRKVVSVAKDVLKGLVVVHEQGLIHRDIKPANLWIEAGTNRVKLLDFGLAKTPSGSVELTARGAMLGTPAYMAPEQAEGLQVDARADLFSVGAVLYRMIAGRSPFQRETVLATLRALATDDPLSVASFGVIPNDLAALIDRLLAKSPEDRPASAKAAIAVVLEVEQELLSGRPASSGVAAMSVTPIPLSDARPTLVPESEVADDAEVEKPVGEMIIRPITTPSGSLEAVPTLPPSRKLVPINATEESWSSVRLLPEERPSDLSLEKKRKGQRVWYRVIATRVAVGLLIAVVAMIVTNLLKEPVVPTTKDDQIDPASTKGSRDATLPVTSGWREDEVVQEFEYMIEDEKRMEKRFVLILDIGGGETMEFVRIPEGSFLMGAPIGEMGACTDEKQHRVETKPDFYLGKYEVTQAQYEAVTGGTPSGFKGDLLRPVEMVSWVDAVTFCETLSTRTKRKVRLPSEAEWEYACRAGTTTPFHFGSTLNRDLANCNGPNKCIEKTVAVGSYPANRWGLHDMHGNVREWCRDFYSLYEQLDGLRNPIRLTRQLEDYMILRGGSWFCNPVECRAAYRRRLSPITRRDFIGFRVAFRLD